jgi:hypothetical protein
MVVLNEPTGGDSSLGDEPSLRGGRSVARDEWTPEHGLLRGAAHGAVAALVIAVGLAPLVAVVPFLFLVLLMRGALAFGVAWVLVRVVCRAAGMEGRACTLIALSFAALVMASHHVVFALRGVPALAGVIDSWWLFPMQLVETLIPEQNGWTSGWAWFNPYVLLAVNAVPLCVLLGVYTFRDAD